MSLASLSGENKSLSETNESRVDFLRFLGTRKAPVLILGVLFCFYLGMFLKYRAYDVDNPWFLSFSYNTCVEHIDTDQYLNVPFPRGMDGTQFFGKLAAYGQCAVLRPLEWQPWPSVILSASLVVLSLGMWWFMLRKLDYPARFSIGFMIVAGLSEPFLSVANKFRYECFSFAFVSLGLLLVSYSRPFWGVLVAALAVEVQPIAIVGIAPVLILVWSTQKITRALMLRLICASALAFTFYLALHPNALHASQYLGKIKSGEISKVGGFFAALLPSASPAHS